MISFEEALAIVDKKTAMVNAELKTAVVPLSRAAGFVLAEDLTADRDYPPFDRATRDGFAVRAADLAEGAATLHIVGEIPAGGHFRKALGAGECARIMTGAAVPEGADAVVMLEEANDSSSEVTINRSVAPFDNVVRRGSEAREGSRVLARGKRVGAGEIALLAATGKDAVPVFEKLAVAILATGDELAPVEAQPGEYQIRNSNSAMLASCVERAGGIPRVLGVARDEKPILRAKITEGLEAPLLVLSGGVSMGAYDLVKSVLTDLGAEFYFHGVAMRPGKPVLFGRARDTLLFGLPGNPVSAFVTFELFVLPAIGVLGGAPFERAVYFRARLGSPARHKPGLTAFLPARVGWEGGLPVVYPVLWQGSGDLVALAAANCFVVAGENQSELAAGDWVNVLTERT